MIAKFRLTACIRRHGCLAWFLQSSSTCPASSAPWSDANLAATDSAMSTVYSERRDKQSEACLAFSPTPLSLWATFLLQRGSQGPMKGFTTEIGCPSNCQNYCQVLLSNSGTSFPSQNSEILHGFKKKKRVHLYVCVIRVSLCVFAGSRGDSCFGLIYQCWYQRPSLSEHIQ